jgi:NAD(P)-dependent dehydrogenase (short-subunit alcohol dehydrogenase family)
MSKQDWALILGASSGFGEATAVELAAAGMNIFGVHLDRRETLGHVAEIVEQIRSEGREAVFFNGNAADETKRASVIAAIGERLEPNGEKVRVLHHSLAFGALKPLTGEGALTQKQIEMTCDVMGHSLIYWARDLVSAGLMGEGGRIFAMTSEGSTRVLPSYGAVSAAKVILESHIRQLAVELAPLRITANAILAGVTDTPALRKIPGSDRLIEVASSRNPQGRLTTAPDIARCIRAFSGPETAWMTSNTIRVDGALAATWSKWGRREPCPIPSKTTKLCPRRSAHSHAAGRRTRRRTPAGPVLSSGRTSPAERR